MEPTTTGRDELDLTVFFRALWAGKWVLLFCSGLGLTCGIFYLFFVPKQYKGELPLKLQPFEYTLSFSPLTSLPYFPENLFESKILFNEFIDTLLFGDLLLKNELAYLPDNQISELGRLDDIDLTKIKNTIWDLKITRTESVEGLNALLAITFLTNDQDQAKKILNDTFKDISIQIREQKIKTFKNIQKNIQIELDFKITHINQQIDNAQKLYTIKQKIKKNFLFEQAAIARALDIKYANYYINTNEQRNFDTRSQQPLPLSVSLNVNQEEKNTRFYLQGYISIEKELSIMQNRKNDDIKSFSPEYPRLSNELNFLLTDNRIERMNKALELTPLKEKSIQSVLLNANLVNFENQTKRNLVILIALFLGFILGLFVLFVKHIQIQPR